jgi:hypothetical protein
MNFLYSTSALIIVLGTLVAVFLVRAFRHHAMQKHAKALRMLLDAVDNLEAQIHDYKNRMTQLKTLLTQLPSDMTSPELIHWDAQTQAQNALRDVLSHRLWIKQESDTAPLAEIDKAIQAVHRSHEKIAHHLQQLNEMSLQLQNAGQNLRGAYQVSSSITATPSLRKNQSKD